MPLPPVLRQISSANPLLWTMLLGVGVVFMQRVPFAVVLLATLLFAPIAQATQQTTGKDVYNKTLRSTALVIAPQGDKASQGTGWLLDKARRWIVTNHHVVGTSERVIVMFPFFRDGKAVAEREFYIKSAPRVNGRVVANDVKRDLALIELDSVPGDAVQVRQAKDSPSPGDNVHAVGNPSASDALWVYTSGTVRQVYRKKITQDNETFDARIIETQSPLNPGDSGGPVLNDLGDLVGVSRAIRVGVQLVAICVDVSEVRDFIREAERNPQRVAEAPKRSTPGPTEARAKAADALKRGQFDAAIQGFTEALKLDPKDAAALSGRGDAFWQKGDYAQAIADFDAAIKLTPTDAVLFNNRGRSLLGKGEHERALADFNEALRLSPRGFPAAFRNRAFVLTLQKDPTAAIADCERALLGSPKDALAYATRGFARAKQGDLAKGLADLAEARKLAASLPATYLDDVKEAARVHPEDAGVQAFLAYVAMTRQSNDLVTLHATEALKLDAKNVLALLARAESSLQRKELDQAIADCTEVIQVDAKLPDAYQLRAKAYLEKGDKEKAESDQKELARFRTTDF